VTRDALSRRMPVLGARIPIALALSAFLFSGGGRRRQGGHDGDDVVTAVDGEVDVIVCGEGNDRVQADALDRVDASCETVERV
jgi:hypothetical protein